jgi:hypothetical protein
LPHDVRLRQIPGPHRLHREDAGAAGALGYIAGRLSAHGEWFLDEDVLPRIDCEGCKACVLLVRRRDIDDVDLPIMRDGLVGAVATLDPVPRSETVGPLT